MRVTVLSTRGGEEAAAALQTKYSKILLFFRVVIGMADKVDDYDWPDGIV